MKRFLSLLLTLLLVLMLIACQKEDVETIPTQSTESQPSSVSTSSSQEALTGAEKNAAALEKYAPTVKTLASGIKIQPVPSDPFVWNTAILNAEERGCTACHTLESAVQNLPLTHPELWNPYDVEITPNFCLMCHSKSLFMSDSVHSLHMNNEGFEGNCLSCHNVSPVTGEYELWDNVKYNTMMGITDIANVKGEFSFTQDSITPTDQIFYYWENGDHRGITPNNDVDPSVYENWEISVEGMVKTPFTFKLSDYEDQMVTRVLKQHCQTNPPAGSYICNCEVTGIPLNVIMEKAGIQEEVNTLRAEADDGWCYPLPMSYINENELILAVKINGETIPMLQGYPVQLWTPGLGGVHFTKRVVKLNFIKTDVETKLFVGFINPKTGDFFNKPNVAIFNYKNGQIFEEGKPITFEGFADAYDIPISAVEFSMDRGKTWTTYDLGETSHERWVNWSFVFTPEKTGSYVLKVRGVADNELVSIMPATIMFNIQ